MKYLQVTAHIEGAQRGPHSTPEQVATVLLPIDTVGPIYEIEESEGSPIRAVVNMRPGFQPAMYLVEETIAQIAEQMDNAG